MKKILLKAVVAFFLLSATVIAFAFYLAHRESARAGDYVKQVAELQVGKSPFQDIIRVSNKHSANVKLSPICNVNECSATFRFRNSWLAHLHLAKPAYLYSVLTASGGTITRINIDGGCYDKNGGLFLASTAESVPDIVFTNAYQISHTEGSGRLSALSIHLTPAASVKQRETAYDFSPKFLGRFGACYDANDILPGLDGNTGRR